MSQNAELLDARRRAADRHRLVDREGAIRGSEQPILTPAVPQGHNSPMVLALQTALFVCGLLSTDVSQSGTTQLPCSAARRASRFVDSLASGLTSSLASSGVPAAPTRRASGRPMSADTPRFGSTFNPSSGGTPIESTAAPYRCQSGGGSSC